MKAVAGPLPTDDGWVYEVKWDGMRVMAHLGPSTVLRSANEIDVTVRFPELDLLGRAVGGADAILDGEVVALDDEGRPSFSALQHRMHVADRVEAERRAVEVPVAYLVFDLLHLDGHDLSTLALSARRQLLEELVEEGPAWRVTDQFDDGLALLDHVREAGLEGVVAKRLDSPYRAGARSKTWRKVKIRREQEFLVGGHTGGEGARSGRFGALLLGYREGGALQYAGRVGTGFSDRELDRLGQQLVELRSSADPFDPPLTPADGRGVSFVAPRLVVQVAFAEWSPDGRLRHPAYLGQRDDVDADEVSRRP